jgi:hypothetical protein
MIDRETVIATSIESYLRNQLYVVRGYPPDRVVMLDAFPDSQRMSRPLDANYIAVGWSADDGGRDAELGSSLRRRLYTFDFYTFAVSRVWGRNLASVVRFCLEADQSIDLLDPGDGQTVTGHVDVEFVSVQQAVAANPRPYEENCWITRLRVVDYYSSAVGG